MSGTDSETTNPGGKDAPDLFTPLALGPYELPNRLVMAPMTRNRAGPSNVPRDMNAEYYVQRAGAGLIVTEGTQVSPQGVGYPGTPGIHSGEIANRYDDRALARYLTAGFQGLVVMSKAGASRDELQDVVRITLGALD